MPDQLINLTIDGAPVSVPPGTLVIEAAKQAGVLVPHYCYHPGLPVAGVCRMCLVEIEKAPKLAIAGALTGVAAYLAFLLSIDVPMYVARWQADLAAGKTHLGALAGLYDIATRWSVTRDFAPWREEMAWMSLYFSAAVWSSLALSALYWLKDDVARLRAGPHRPGWVATLFAGAQRLR